MRCEEAEPYSISVEDLPHLPADPTTLRDAYAAARARQALREFQAQRRAAYERERGLICPYCDGLGGEDCHRCEDGYVPRSPVLGRRWYLLWVAVAAFVGAVGVGWVMVGGWR